MIDLAEFFLSNACTVELVRSRFPYDDPDLGSHLFAQLEQRGLIDAEGHPSDGLLATLRQILLFRAQVAASMWPGNLAVAIRGAGEVLAVASGNVTNVFRSLPEPQEPAHHLHHLLTGLRYARLDAHVLAWRAAGLTADEVSDLNFTSPARMSVEAQTNDRCEPIYETVEDLADWHVTIDSLHNEPS